MLIPRPVGRWLLALLGATTYGRRPGAADGGGHEAEELLRSGRFADAERAFERAAAGSRESRPLLALGHLALLRDDLPRAGQHLKQALALDRTNRDARGLLAEVHYRRREFDAAAALAESSGSRATARKLRSFAGRGPYTIEGPPLTALPFATRDPLPIVKARVNGGDEALFLLDTGGGELILDTSVAESCRARRFGRERSFFGGGKKAAFEHGAVESIGLGEMTVRDVPAVIMALPPVRTALGQPSLAGIIGTSLFYRFRATIDYPGGQLVLAMRETPVEASGPGSVEIPFWLAGDHFIVAEGRLNDGPTLMLLVDTGLGGAAFTAPPSTLDAAGIDLRKAARQDGMVAAGRLDVRPFPIGSLALGEARREDLVGLAGVFPPQLEWEYGVRIGGLISHEFFRPYALTFDFSRMVIRLVPQFEAPSPPKYSR